MPRFILMPALSPTMTEGHLVKWHKSPGDKVKPGDLLMDVETDKAVMEVEATQGGILDRFFVQAPTQSVQVGTHLALLRDENEIITDDMAFSQSEPASQASAPSASTPASQPLEQHPEIQDKSALSAYPAQLSPSPSFDNQRPLISPLARRMAHQQGIEIDSLQGSGPRGRIVKKDIENAKGPQVSQGTSQAPSAGFVSAESITPGEFEKIPLTGMRKVIAQRLSLSKQTIPHFYLSVECALDELLALREKLNTSWGEKILSVNDFMVKACAMALRAVPEMRTLWSEECYLRSPSVDLAIAVSIKGGLITPIVFQADTKSLRKLALELRSLIQRAREGKLAPQEYQGGIFTLSNLGMFGIETFQAIINPPHSGILAIGAGIQKPIVKNGNITIGTQMSACVAADHRVVDGEVAATFLTTFKKLVESPFRLLE